MCGTGLDSAAGIARPRLALISAAACLLLAEPRAAGRQVWEPLEELGVPVALHNLHVVGKQGKLFVLAEPLNVLLNLTLANSAAHLKSCGTYSSQEVSLQTPYLGHSHQKPLIRVQQRIAGQGGNRLQRLHIGRVQHKRHISRVSKFRFVG